jgi:hypothetical protein
MSRRSTLSALLALLLGACSGAAPSSTDCTPGLSVGCVCPNGRAGAQRCRADRTFDVCVCADVDAGPEDATMVPPRDATTEVGADLPIAPPADVNVTSTDGSSTDGSSTDGSSTDGTTTDVTSTDVTSTDAGSPAEACTPGQLRCGADLVREECRSDGAGYLRNPCDAGALCQSGRCLRAVCVPGATRCAAVGGLQRCDADGLGYTLTACPTGQSCEEGVCLPNVCTPGQSRCLNADTVRVCSGDGRSSRDSVCRVGDVCNDSYCRGDACPRGGATCDGPLVRRVCTNGAAWVNERCALGQGCALGQCAPQLCEPGAVRCDASGALRTCNADGLSETARTCGTGQACRLGACVTAVCPPGERVCVDGTRLRTCSLDGSGTVVTTCAAPPGGSGAACSAGRCTFTCTPGLVALGALCVPEGAPRPVSPRVDAVVGDTPRFRWIAPPNTVGVRIEVCLDRACATVVRTLDAAASAGTAALPLPLPRRRFFWRVRMSGATAFGAASAAWPFTVGLRGNAQGVSDTNADGFADVAIGMPGLARIRIFRGQSAGLQDTSVQLLAASGDPETGYGGRLAWVGDFNGDGASDLLLGLSAQNELRVLDGGGTYGRFVRLLGSGDLGWGLTATAAGDVNGDGRMDVVGGSREAPAGVQNRGLVAFGASDPTAARDGAVFIRASAAFSATALGAGDVNGDGFADIAMGYRFERRVDVFHGSAQGLPASPSTSIPLTLSEAGLALGRLGDIDGDGYPEVAVGAPGQDTSGVVVLRGGPSGLSTTPWFTYTRATTARFADQLDGAGDVNGDGFGDLVVRTPEGFLLFTGSPRGFETTAMRAVTTTLPLTVVRGVGDVNNDGYGDVLAGAGGRDTVFVYLGGPAGLSPTPSQTLRDVLASNFGADVAGAP